MESVLIELAPSSSSSSYSGLTSSAGVAGNKLLAKVGSAMHKPNKQTIVPPRAVAALVQVRAA